MNINNFYMRMAIALARKAAGRTSPNPLVGAVIVNNNKVVGTGYHRKAGLPHAEVIAIREAGPRVRGATLYVTLEPCDHFGRTPPCTDAIINSGIKNVVIGMVDPNPINNGRGIKKLNRNRIKTKVGVLRDEAMAINRPYIKYVTKKLPYVTIKAGQSIDGKIATRTGDSKWVTGEEARRYVHHLRGRVDAVMVGVNTLLRDDPRLTSRIAGAKQPVRIIVDSKLKTPLNAKIFADISKSPVIIATTSRSGKMKALENKGADVLVVKSSGGKVDLKDLLKRLAKIGITDILSEGGGELNASLLENKLADRAMFFIAPKIVGGRDALTSVEGRGAAFMKGSVLLKRPVIKKFKYDILIEGELC